MNACLARILAVLDAAHPSSPVGDGQAPTIVTYPYSILYLTSDVTALRGLSGGTGPYRVVIQVSVVGETRPQRDALADVLTAALLNPATDLASVDGKVSDVSVSSTNITNASPDTGVHRVDKRFAFLLS